MSSLNKVELIGHLGSEPKIRYLPNGDITATVSIATKKTWKDKTTNEKQERTEWHRVVFFRNLAKIVEEYLKKGKYVYIEGELRTQKWTDKDGIERYTTQIIAEELKMLDKKAKESEAQEAATHATSFNAAAAYANDANDEIPPPEVPVEDNESFW